VYSNCYRNKLYKLQREILKLGVRYRFSYPQVKFLSKALPMSVICCRIYIHVTPVNTNVFT